MLRFILAALLAVSVARAEDPTGFCQQVGTNTFRACGHGFFAVEGQDKTEGPEVDYANVACNVAARVAFRSCENGTLAKSLTKNGFTCAGMGTFYREVIQYACDVSNTAHTYDAQMKQCREKWAPAAEKDFATWCSAQVPEEQPIPEKPQAKPAPKVEPTTKPGTVKI